MESVERMQMVRDNRGVWADKYRLERHNYHGAQTYLKQQGKISTEDYLALGELKDKRFDKINRMKEIIFDQLFELKEKQIDKVKQKISPSTHLLRI